jgi:hypothetical protein
MTPFVVAAFSGRGAAEAALERLRDSGIATGDIRLHDSTSDVRNAGALETDELVSGGFFGNFVGLLDNLFGTRPEEPDAASYDEMVRREATLVSVHVDTADTARQVAELLSSEGAKRVATLPQAGLES